VESAGGAVSLELSLVAAAWDERPCIEEFVRELDDALGRLGRRYEIVCVDDGSSDGTREALRGLKRHHPALRVLALRRHVGQSAALAAGIRGARGRLIGMIDADLQNDPADFEKMLACIDGAEQPDCVTGRRVHRSDPWLRRASSRVANRVRALLDGGPVEDSACGIRLCRAEALRRVPMFAGAHRFIPTLIRLEGGKVIEIDVNHRARRCGRSKYGHGLGRARVALVDALAVRWMQRRRISAEADEL
jgi:dolichol-phosphate mannosyltransferase